MMQLDSPGTRYGRRLRAALATGLGLLLGTAAQAQQAGFFRDDAAARSASPLAATLPAARPLSLDVAGLRAALATAPVETQSAARPLVLTLPLPDGSSARFRVLEAPVMAPGLAARFPDIKTYAGVGLDDPQATVRLDLTSRGFHAQVLSPTTGAFYIDPSVQVAAPKPTRYLSFWKRDMPATSFLCGVPDEPKQLNRQAGTAQRSVGTTLRTYRLAVAATAEYTAYQSQSLGTGATNAQKIAATQAAIVTSVNRVVGVYEKELAVRLILVANNSSLIYLDPNTDPYTNDNPNGELLDENQTTVDALIGPANYDIGHVFSTAGGGLAGLGVVCRDGLKAQGETGTNAPVNDAFDIDYVAHEMGHQFGANHTFNGTGQSCGGGNRNASTAYEPGSGTTIMAYAGICGTANNVQNNSDAYFHVVSFEEIQTYLGTTSCAITSATGNNPPTVAALPANGKVLPISTPFKLTARAYDSDSDQLAYCWEEYDLGSGGSPTANQTANNNVPLFRSFYPTTSPTRYFPRLSNIIANTTALGERLPTVARTLTFRVTLRDRFTTANTGFGTAVGGVNSSLPVTMTTTAAAGPFLVTYPDATGLSLAGGSSQTVTWNVAGTDANGVNCANVNILLSTDGGLTYPTVLLANTPNDGTQAVTLPSVASTTARIMIEAADNYFFDISNNNFAITTATPCGPASAVTVSNVTGTTATVSFTAGTSATGYVVTTSPATTSQTVTGTSATLTGLAPGTTYTVLVQSACAGGTTATATSATFSTTPLPACNEVTNLRVTGSTATSLTIGFTGTTNGTGYVVTTSPATTTQTVTGTSATLTGLTAGVLYTIYVQSTCTGGGTASTSFTAGVPPANDNCIAAVSLTPASSCNPVSGTTVGATSSGLATGNDCPAATSNDVWYSFVATSTNPTVRVVTTTFDVVVQLVTGSCTNPTISTCADQAGVGTENLALTGLTIGNRYFVRVYPYGLDNGTFTICVLAPAPTCNAPTNAAVSNTSGTSAALTFTSNALGATYSVTTSPATSTYSTNGTTGLVNLTNLTPNTQYTVTLTGTCSNGTVLAPVTVTFTSATATATAAALELSQASIVPNPAHGTFAVQLPVVSGQRPVQATLLTVLGQPVLSRNLTPTAGGATADFDVHSLAQGVYILRLTAGDQSVVRRVVLE